MSAAEAFPLAWPEGHPRSKYQKEGLFLLAPTACYADLEDQVRKLGGEALIISSNVPLRRNGTPYHDFETEDPGVAVYFMWNGSQRSMACDTYDTPWKNVRALALCVKAMRDLDRHGSSAILERAFRGFTALPAEASAASWWGTLGVTPGASRADIDSAFRRLALEAHPDKGGSHEHMSRLSAAYAEAKAVAR